MDQKINVLIVEPGKEPRLSTVTDNLETLQQIVGGPVEAGCYLPQRVMLISNGEGKKMGLPPNRPNPNDSEGLICGTFLLCSFEGEHFLLPSRRGSRHISLWPIWKRPPPPQRWAGGIEVLDFTGVSYQPGWGLNNT